MATEWPVVQLDVPVRGRATCSNQLNLMITFLIESWTAEHAVSLDVPFMWVISCQMPNGFMSMMYIRSGSCAGDWILEVSS